MSYAHYRDDTALADNVLIHSSAALPACVTITNVVNSQYIMYCAQESMLETLSYTNLVTIGSMALPPTHTQSSSASMTSAIVAATLVATSSTTTDANVVSAPTESAAAGNMPAPPTTEAAVVIGSSVGLMLLVVITYHVVGKWRRRKRERETIRNAASHHRSDTFEIPDDSRPTTNTTSATIPRRLQRPPTVRGKSMISTTDAMNLDDYLSPIAHERLARQAEARDAARAEELDGSESAPYLDAEGKMKDSWTPPSIRTTGEANPSARWSASNAPGLFKAYQATNSLSELSSIRHVQPSGSHRSSFKSSESIPVSPNPSNYVDTPLVGGVSPLMDKWHTDDRASVGETSATVNGPINLFSPMHVQSRPAIGSHVTSLSMALTNSRGLIPGYVSPETAMAEGYSAGSDGHHESK
jgi:hypothetical protein